jgi:ABC-type uncharacterized transport system permease subunit
MFKEVITGAFVISFLYSVIRMATPLIYASMGAIISKQAGTNNLAIEATMLISSMVGCITSVYIPNILVAIVAAIVAGILLSLFLAFMFLKLEANCTMTCISLNTMTTGLAMFIPFALFGGSKGSSMGKASLTFPSVQIPLIKDIPVLGNIVSGHCILTYLTIVVTFLVWFIIFRTSFGLRMRAAGENPDSAMSVGIDVYGVKLKSFILTGIVCSLGGCFMSMYYLSWFTAGMVAGRGFIGVSISNLTGGKPFMAVLVALVFGAIDAMALTFQSAFNFPAEILQMMPYIATIIGVTLVSHLEVKRKQKLLAK